MSKNQYMTLMGDPIHTNIVRSALTSDDTKATGVALAFNALLLSSGSPEALTQSLLHIAKENAFLTLTNRFALERFMLGKFSGDMLISSDTLQDLCIDTAPTPQMGAKSVKKYKHPITNAKVMYGIFLGIDAGGTAITGLTKAWAASTTGQALNEQDSVLLSSNIASIVRMYQGFQRFNKLSKGDWAIIQTPEKEVVLDKDFMPA